MDVLPSPDDVSHQELDELVQLAEGHDGRRQLWRLMLAGVDPGLPQVPMVGVGDGPHQDDVASGLLGHMYPERTPPSTFDECLLRSETLCWG